MANRNLTARFSTNDATSCKNDSQQASCRHIFGMSVCFACLSDRLREPANLTAVCHPSLAIHSLLADDGEILRPSSEPGSLFSPGSTYVQADLKHKPPDYTMDPPRYRTANLTPARKLPSQHHRAAPSPTPPVLVRVVDPNSPLPSFTKAGRVRSQSPGPRKLSRPSNSHASAPGQPVSKRWPMREPLTKASAASRPDGTISTSKQQVALLALLEREPPKQKQGRPKPGKQPFTAVYERVGDRLVHDVLAPGVDGSKHTRPWQR